MPCPDQLMTTLTYLYTGNLPSLPPGPDIVFGLLQNAHYLACDRLIHDCSGLLIKEVKALTDPDVASPWIFHKAFKLAWVSADVVKSILSPMAPRQAIRMFDHWLMDQTSFDSHVEAVIALGQTIADKCSVEDVNALSGSLLQYRLITHTLASSFIQMEKKLQVMNQALIGARVKIKWSNAKLYPGTYMDDRGSSQKRS